MKLGALAGELLIGVIYIAIVYALVRPGSPAAGAVTTISNLMIGLVGSVTGSNNFGGITT